MGKKKAEKRGFTVHDREYWWTKKQLEKELSVPVEQLDEVWEGGKRAKEAVKESKKKLPAAKPGPAIPSGAEITTAMKQLEGDVTSTVLRDHFGLDKDNGRDIIRRIMKQLEKDGEIVISKKGKRQFVYKLVEK